MIPLKRTCSPIVLSPNAQNTRDLITAFVEAPQGQKPTVWKDRSLADDLKEHLLHLSHYKCCYCECQLNQEDTSVYMEVEHYHPKSLYPQEVLDWENLLPSCKDCNGNKRDLDTKILPIVKPDADNPKDHLYTNNIIIKGKTDIGKRTILELQLNRLRRRFQKVTNNIYDSCASMLVNVERYDELSQPAAKNRVKNAIYGVLITLLEEAQPTAPYAAMTATILLHNEDYLQAKQLMQINGLWTDQLSALEAQALFCKFDVHL